MSYCPKCGETIGAADRFCGSCGNALARSEPRPMPPRSVSKGSSDWLNPNDWLKMDDVVYTRDRRMGGIGVIVAFVGAFIPWASASISFLGASIGSYGYGTPLAWLVALAAIAAGVFLFRRGSGSVVMGIGIGIAGYVILFCLGTLSSHGSPSWGALFCLAGGGMTGYSGYMTNLYERG